MLIFDYRLTTCAKVSNENALRFADIFRPEGARCNCLNYAVQAFRRKFMIYFLTGQMLLRALPAYLIAIAAFHVAVIFGLCRGVKSTDAYRLKQTAL